MSVERETPTLVKPSDPTEAKAEQPSREALTAIADYQSSISRWLLIGNVGGIALSYAGATELEPIGVPLAIPVLSFLAGAAFAFRVQLTAQGLLMRIATGRDCSLYLSGWGWALSLSGWLFALGVLSPLIPALLEPLGIMR